MRTSVTYLLHFSKPFGHARHYLGSTADLAARVSDHAKGNGAVLTAHAASVGITFTIARTWAGGRAVEKRFKKPAGRGTGARYGYTRLCPLCQGKGATR